MEHDDACDKCCSDTDAGGNEDENNIITGNSDDGDSDTCPHNPESNSSDDGQEGLGYFASRFFITRMLHYRSVVGRPDIPFPYVDYQLERNQDQDDLTSDSDDDTTTPPLTSPITESDQLDHIIPGSDMIVDDDHVVTEFGEAHAVAIADTADPDSGNSSDSSETENQSNLVSSDNSEVHRQDQDLTSSSHQGSDSDHSVQSDIELVSPSKKRRMQWILNCMYAYVGLLTQIGGSRLFVCWTIVSRLI